MRTTRAKLTQLLGLFAVLTLIVAGCGGAGGGGASGDVDLSGAEFTVGSKEFTEQLILGQITLQVLENAGATVNDQIGLAGTVAARKALESGEIDMYWEYTGTGWITHLGHTKPIPDRQKQFEAVAKEDLKKNGIEWLSPPAPANNTYTMAVRSEAYDKLGVKKLSTSSSWSRRTRKRLPCAWEQSSRPATTACRGWRKPTISSSRRRTS